MIKGHVTRILLALSSPFCPFLFILFFVGGGAAAALDLADVL
jgi:hypothetical protein